MRVTSAQATQPKAAAVMVTGMLTGVLGQALSQAQDVVLPAAATFDSDLDNVLTKMPYTLQFTGADKEGCQAGLNDLSETSVGVDRDVVCPSLSAQLATYFADSGSSYKTTICTCDGGPYDAESLASLVSGIPPFLLYFVRGVTSVKHGGNTHVSAKLGQMQVFASADLRDITYEAAHAQDYATGIMNSYFTSSSAWLQAVSQSSCSATAWGAQTGPVNEYADAVLAYVYKLHHGTPALDTGCLEPELDAIETYAYLLSSGQK